MFICKGEHDGQHKVLAMFETSAKAEEYVTARREQGLETYIDEKDGHVDPPEYVKR